MNQSLRHAFTLMEMAIILVVIGFLVGVILVGETLIHAAQVNSIATQLDSYTVAVHLFRAKYHAYPGDMNNATDYWTSAGGNGSDAACLAAQTQTSSKTCNGNGNERIDNNNERFLAWKHLANAELIEGSYTGAPASGVGTFTPQAGLNIPAGKITNTFFDLYYISKPIPPATSDFFTESTLDQNFISLFRVPDTSSAPNIAALTPEDAWKADTKFDDGNPVYGSIITLKKSAHVGANCSDADKAPANYNVSDSGINCILYSGGRI